MASNANTGASKSFRSSKSFSSEWTQENQKLLEAGYLKSADGTLVKWSPNQEPDPLLVKLEKLAISKKVAIPLSMEVENGY